MATPGSGGGDDDPLFLSLVEEAERRATRSAAKRPLPSVPLPPSKFPKPQGEGSYLAALRGTHSPLWRDLQKPSPAPPSGSCFHCGSEGHWARDCPTVPPNPGKSHVPDKECPCGAGRCLVRTSSTARNPGRQFYRCPVKEDNGGCNFFEWCDGLQLQSEALQPRAEAAYSAGRGSGTGEMKCPCGAGWCLVLTAKSGSNAGQSYYRCPSEGGRSCRFFKWCNPSMLDYQDSLPRNAPSQVSVGKSSSCFKCGLEGHWSKNCPNLQTNNSTCTSGVSSTPSGTCFKCGKAGHWARDCSDQFQSARLSK